jgi:trehalose/maltose hydrolase-like predicted phosphorylase
MEQWDNAQILKKNYSGETFQGSYIAGIYYPDKTKLAGGKLDIKIFYKRYKRTKLDWDKCNVLNE